ncbi:MAG: FG-GAP-like repeat-containing protein, partial [Vicinamibacterales bacterium]
MTRGPLAALAAAALLAVGLSAFQGPARSGDREGAYRANNAGISFLEQFDYDTAAESFRTALTIDPTLTLARINLALALFYANNPDDSLTEATAAAAQAPDSPQAHYLLGLLARSLNRPEDAVTQFRRVLDQDRDDVGTKVNLGQVYVQERNYPAALTLLREAIVTEPYNVTAAYTLATALTRSGAPEDGRVAMERFQALRDSTYGNTYAQTYLAQGKYAEAIASTGAEAGLVDAAAPTLTFTDATGAMLPSGPAGQPASAASGSVTLIDLDHDGALDLVSAGPAGLRHFRNVRGVLREEPAPLGRLADGAATGVVAADYDNDGRVDLFVLRGAGNQLLHQRADGTFEDASATARVGTSSSAARSAAFADVDHDGDLDVLIASAATTTASSANQLLRNNGDGTFTDITAAAKVAGAGGDGIAVVPTDFDNRRDMDLLVVQRGGRPALFQNVRDGSFRDVAAEVGLPGAAPYSSVAAADVNKDGYTDLFLGRADGPGTLVISDGNGRFLPVAGPPASAGALAAQFVDVDNDGLLDLVVLSANTLHLFRNLGSRWTELPSGLSDRGAALQAMAVGDLDDDGDEDLVVRLSSGDLRVWRNDGGNANHSILVRLTGRVSNRNGVGAKIDLRAGSLRQRREASAATPSFAPADVRFGLGPRTVVDAIRVLWPSGTLQTEVDTGAEGATAKPLAAGTLLPITELDRKPSSCPFLYTWNGTRFEFVTDFMGGGELGHWLAPGQWAQPDPDEYVRIRGDQLVPRNGRYELRVTNELEETLFA